MSHECHAKGCRIEVPPKLLMCPRHWWMVPLALRRRVWQTYRLGQDIDKDPTDEYLEAAQDAINAVEKKEREGGTTVEPLGRRR